MKIRTEELDGITVPRIYVTTAPGAYLVFRWRTIISAVLFLGFFVSYATLLLYAALTY